MDDRGRAPGSAQRGERAAGRPDYKVYRSRPAVLERLRGQRAPRLPRGRAQRRPRRRAPRPRSADAGRRALRYAIMAGLTWLGLSLVLFGVSAQIEESKASGAAERALDTGAPMPFAPNTILVLGSDARPRGTGEDGANVVGEPSRSDTILLLRTGGFASGRLSIPRDTVADIPGHGPDKINAAYAIGGPALAITTVKRFLGVDVNHLIEVNFADFPVFIDALGGIDVATDCVRGELDGGDDNGGTTIDLKPGINHLDGRHALGLARLRRNACATSEGDIERAQRQQAILTAIKRRLVSPSIFLRLPLVAWTAPRAISTDMSGLSLLGLFAAVQMGGSPEPHVLNPSGIATTSGGGTGLTVSEEERRRAVERFLGG